MQTCASCGATLRPRAQFCTVCGTTATARRGFPWKWAVAGVVVAATLLLVVALRPPPAPSPSPSLASSPEASSVALVERAFPDLGFAVSHPATWISSRRTIEEGRVAALFRDPESGTRERPERAFDVISENVSLSEARGRVEEDFRARFPGYAKIGITDGLQAAGRPAFRHEFFVERLRYVQWWIERDGGSLRVTFWGPRTQRAGRVAMFTETILATLRFL